MPFWLVNWSLQLRQKAKQQWQFHKKIRVGQKNSPSSSLHLHGLKPMQMHSSLVRSDPNHYFVLHIHERTSLSNQSEPIWTVQVLSAIPVDWSHVSLLWQMYYINSMGDQSLHWRVLQAAEIPMTEQSKKQNKTKPDIKTTWYLLTHTNKYARC